MRRFSNSSGTADANNPLHPADALQTAAAGDLVPLKQRLQAAQQLDAYVRQLAPTPALYLSYEPFLPALAAMLTTVASKASSGASQTTVLHMLAALSSHNPRRSVERAAITDSGVRR